MLLSSASRPSIPFFLLIPTTLLLVAYLWAIYTRPPVPRHAKINDPARFGWPEWYGHDGLTPYDRELALAEGAREIPRTVLLFIDLPYGHQRIPHALNILTTLQSDPSVNLTVITPWMDSWRDDVRIAQNIEYAGCGEWLWRIGNDVRDMPGACKDAVVISEIVSGSYGSTEPLPVDPRANITIMPQPHDMVHSEKSFQSLSESLGDAWEMGLFSHVLPYADSHVYYPSREVLNRKGVTYFPCRETPSSDYPALPWGRIWHLHRPERIFPPPKHVGIDPLAEGSTYRRFWAREEAKRAAVMRQAGVCLFEGWDIGILDERVAQAMLSGCVVAMVQPDVHHDVLEPFMIPLSRPANGTAQLPSDELRRKLSKTSTAELKRKALHAFIFARQKFVPASGIISVFDATKRWEEGGRGYMFPNGWRWSCSTGGEDPPWCT